MTKIPRTLEDITPAWLASALDPAKVPNPPTSVDAARIGEGGGFMGQVARLTLEYDGEAGPGSMVVKLPTTNEAMRQVGITYGMYERECRFYEELAPKVDIRTPTAFVNQWDVAAGDFILILEDFPGAEVGDQVEGVDADRAETILSTIARFHAAWWRSDALEEIGTWAVRPDDPATLEPAGQMFTVMWPSMKERFTGTVPDEVLGWAEAAGMDIVDRLVGQARSHDGNTIAHSDFRLDNMLFTPEGEPVLIDWQGLAIARPVGDVLYFLGTNLTPEVRRASEDRLLRSYYATFAGLAKDPQTFDEFLDDFHRGMVNWLPLALAQVGGIDPSNERGAKLLEAILERVVALVIDHDAGQYL